MDSKGNYVQEKEVFPSSISLSAVAWTGSGAVSFGREFKMNGKIH